jgi:Ca2+/Na+ antiporter
MMRRTSALVQIVIILLVVGYGTYHLYRGNFEVSMSTLPFLVAYYVFVVVRQKRNKGRDDDEQCGAGDSR